MIFDFYLYKKALYDHAGTDWDSPNFHLGIKSSEKKIQQQAKANFTGVKFNPDSFHMVFFIIDDFLSNTVVTITIRVPGSLLAATLIRLKNAPPPKEFPLQYYL